MKKFLKLLKKPIAAQDGSITIEFLFWAPLLFFWLIGSIVFFDAFKTRGQLTSSTATVADIISRNSEANQPYIDLLELMQSAMMPRTQGNGLRVSSIEFTDGPPTYTVQWSAISGAAVDVLIDTDIDIPSLPNMYDGETIILVESTVPYVPLTTFLGVTLQTLRTEIAISPRYESRVVWVP